MYIYDRKTSGAASVTKERPITSRLSQRYSPLSGISGDTSKPATSRLRIGTYWANDFSKGCKDDDRLNHSDDLALGFARAMAAQGHKWAVNHGSSHASPTDWLSFPDPKGTPFDNSDVVQGVDTTDFAYLVTHGGVTYVDKPHPIPDLYVFRAGFGLNAPLGPSTAFKVESSSRDTWPRCIWFNNKSRLGDKNLRWLVVDACESLQVAGYVTGLKMNLDVNPAKMWHQAFHGLNMVFGFTGYSSDAWWTDQRGSTFGRRAGGGDKLAGASQVPSTLKVLSLEKVTADQSLFTSILSGLGPIVGLSGFRWKDSDGWTEAESGDARVSINRKSGAVRFWTRLNVRESPKATFSIPEPHLAFIARNFLKKTGWVDTPIDQLKVRHISYLRLQTASANGKVTTPTILDAGVIFGREIDGVPVSGPGGYVMVNVAPDESVVAGTKVWRRLGVSLGTAKVLMDEQHYLEPAYAFVYEYETRNRFPYKSAMVIPAIMGSRQRWNSNGAP